MRRLKYLFLAFVLIFSIVPVKEASATEQDRLMKVKLKNYLSNPLSITLTSNGTYLTADREIFLKKGEEVKIKVESGQLVVYNGLTRVKTYDTISISPVSPDSLLSINNRSYHGTFEFTVDSGKYVRPINILYIEDYLKGVVPREMPALWHIEALKSQAIAARTYALINQSKVIDDTVSYQVYGGAEGHVNSDKAILDTTGLVLKYNNSLIDAVFSSSNGGVTELNSNAWSGALKVPFFEIKEDPFDPKTVWSITVDKQQINLSNKDLSKPDEWWKSVKEKDSSIVPNIKTWLQSNGYYNKDIKIIDIPILSLGNKSSGGRVTKGSIQVNFYVKDLVDEKGVLVPKTIKFTDVSASKIRAIVGTDKIKSYLVDESTSTGNTILIKGRGYGHGVGLSQYGAKYRADAGQTYRTILQFYYPRTTLVKEYRDMTEDTVAPSITAVTTASDYSTNSVKIAYTVDEDSIVSVSIKDQEGKVIATPVKQKSVKKGNNSTSWNFSNNSNGSYIVSIAAKGSNQKTETATKTIKIKKTNGKVTASILNIREKKSTLSKRIGQLKKNQIITILAKENNWYKIKTKNKIGYVLSKYVTVTF